MATGEKYVSRHYDLVRGAISHVNSAGVGGVYCRGQRVQGSQAIAGVEGCI